LAPCIGIVDWQRTNWQRNAQAYWDPRIMPYDFHPVSGSDIQKAATSIELATSVSQARLHQAQVGTN